MCSELIYFIQTNNSINNELGLIYACKRTAKFRNKGVWPCTLTTRVGNISDKMTSHDRRRCWTFGEIKTKKVSTINPHK